VYTEGVDFYKKASEKQLGFFKICKFVVD